MMGDAFAHHYGLEVTQSALPYNWGMGSGMMGFWDHQGMMGWLSGFWIWSLLAWVTWILVIVALIALIRWLWKKGDDRKK